MTGRREYHLGMGLADEIGYEIEPGSGYRKAVQSASRSRIASWLLRFALRPLDLVARRLTRGRSTLSDWLAGLPPIWLTTTGARSGLARETPLYGVPFGEGLAVLGTSFGQPQTPGWVFNLEADPNAVLRYRGLERRVVARRATPDEEPKIWDAASSIYRGYGVYRKRAPHREIRVFVLEPVP